MKLYRARFSPATTDSSRKLYFESFAIRRYATHGVRRSPGSSTYTGTQFPCFSLRMMLSIVDSGGNAGNFCEKGARYRQLRVQLSRTSVALTCVSINMSRKCPGSRESLCVMRVERKGYNISTLGASSADSYANFQVVTRKSSMSVVEHTRSRSGLTSDVARSFAARRSRSKQSRSHRST